MAMDQICIIETALPIDVADLPEGLLAPIAFRPYMAKVERSRPEMNRAQRQTLERLYADYYFVRHGAFRDRYNREAEQAKLALFMKRRRIDRHTQQHPAPGERRRGERGPGEGA